MTVPTLHILTTPGDLNIIKHKHLQKRISHGIDLEKTQNNNWNYYFEITVDYLKTKPEYGQTNKL